MHRQVLSRLDEEARDSQQLARRTSAQHQRLPSVSDTLQLALPLLNIQFPAREVVTASLSGAALAKSFKESSASTNMSPTTCSPLAMLTDRLGMAHTRSTQMEAKNSFTLPWSLCSSQHESVWCGSHLRGQCQETRSTEHNVSWKNKHDWKSC